MLRFRQGRPRPGRTACRPGCRRRAFQDPTARTGEKPSRPQGIGRPPRALQVVLAAAAGPTAGRRPRRPFRRSRARSIDPRNRPPDRRSRGSAQPSSPQAFPSQSGQQGDRQVPSRHRDGSSGSPEQGSAQDPQDPPQPSVPAGLPVAVRQQQDPSVQMPVHSPQVPPQPSSPQVFRRSPAGSTALQARSAGAVPAGPSAAVVPALPIPAGRRAGLGRRGVALPGAGHGDQPQGDQEGPGSGRERHGGPPSGGRNSHTGKGGGSSTSEADRADRVGKGS
jgi:hypothetical protein